MGFNKQAFDRLGQLAEALDKLDWENLTFLEDERNLLRMPGLNAFLPGWKLHLTLAADTFACVLFDLELEQISFSATFEYAHIGKGMKLIKNFIACQYE